VFLFISVVLAILISICLITKEFRIIDKELESSQKWLKEFQDNSKRFQEEFEAKLGKPVNLAGVMLIVKDGMILGVSRRNNHSIFGLAGGKCFKGEDTRTAAIRETYEETGVVVYNCVEFHERLEPAGDDGIDFYCRYYYALNWAGEPKTNEEGVVQWLTEQEITETKAAFPKYIKDVFAAFHQKFPEIKLK
jgi:8-oxo-dGTP pyrophosphatase MutT (NUDIX family)